MASANQNGHRLIGVVFGGRSGSSRNAHMEELLNAGFKKIKIAKTIKQSPPPLPPMKPTYGVAQVKVKTKAIAPDKTESYASLTALENDRKKKIQRR